MANKLSNAQRQIVIESLNLDKNSNYSRLEYYLKQILVGRDVTFETRSDTPFTVSPEEAWDIISTWGSDPSVNLPLGDRGSRKTRASRLLNYLDTNILGKTAEAAASYQAILDQADKPFFAPNEQVADTTGKALQKSFEIRREQIKALQGGLIGKLTTNLEKTKFLQSIEDVHTRVLVSQMFAVASANFRVPSDYTPEKINQLLLPLAGVGSINLVMHQAYSEHAKEMFAEISETIDSGVRQQYQGDETKYLQDVEKLRDLSTLSPDVSDIPWMVNHIAVAATAEEKTRLITALRSQVIISARGQHRDGSALLQDALTSAGLSGGDSAHFAGLFSSLEEMEIKERSSLLGSDLADRDSRLLSTSGLAAQLGVSRSIPWLKQNDLDKMTRQLLGEYKVSSLEAAFTAESTKAGGPDLKKLAQIKDLVGKTNDFHYYQGSLRNSLSLRLQNTLAKGTGTFAAYKQPVDRFTQKLWKGYDKVDSVINWPARTLVNRLEKLQERFPLLNPAGYVLKRWNGFQTGIALRIHSWALSVHQAGGLFGGFAGHISDFTEGFVKYNADWSSATHFFINRKWGNVLDWTAQKAFKQESWAALKGTIGTTLKNFAFKVAPGLSAKVAAYAAEIGLSFEGIGLALLAVQVGWDVLSFGFNAIKNFLTNAGGFRDTVLNWLPVIIGGAITFAVGLPALMLAGFTGLGALALAFLAAIAGSLVTLFLSAGLWSLAIVGGVALFTFVILNPTFQLDSGISQLETNILCDQSGNNTSINPIANNALCIAKVLSGCQLNPLFQNELAEPSWKCVVAGLLVNGAVAQLQISQFLDGWPTKVPHLQCVGLAAAAAGSGFPQTNACNYANPQFTPNGFTYLAGCPNMQPGDLFIMGASTCSDKSVGHIGVVIKTSPGDDKFTCVDANFAGPGQVRSDASCFFMKDQISGCLRKK